MQFLMLKNNFGDWKNARKACLQFWHISHLIPSYPPPQLYQKQKKSLKSFVKVKTKAIYQNIREKFVQENLHYKLLQVTAKFDFKVPCY